jgi:hypothetical protein
LAPFAERRFIKISKPFIRIIRSVNAGYFYDVGKNDIIRVRDDVYAF